MRVLHVLSDLDPRSGGPAEALRGLAAAQIREGLRVSVLGTWRRGADLGFADQLAGRGVGVNLVGPCYGPLCWRPGLGRRVRAAVRAADVVHVHALWEAVQHSAAAECRRAGVPYLVRPCGMLDPWSLAQGGLKKRCYLAWRLRRDLARAGALHFTTAIERDLAAPLGLSTPGIVEPNGIDPAEFSTLPPRGTLRAALGIPAGTAVVLFLGRLHPKKGLDLLVPAFARLPGGPHLVVAGPDSDGCGATLEREALRLGVRNRVHFAGMVRGGDKLAALADADLFALPSRQENFGNAVVEALAAGVPVVVSDQVNLWPVIRDERVGGVVRLEVESIAAELARWLADPAERAAAGARGRGLIRRSFDWLAIARRWAGHYRRIGGTDAAPVKQSGSRGGSG